MKWPWTKEKPAAPQEEPKEPEQITFMASDQPIDRAKKIWRALGFVNDRFNAIPQLSAYLYIYRDWDRQQGMLSEERIMAWVRMMPRKEDGSYDLERFSVMDVEACIRGALKEQAKL